MTIFRSPAATGFTPAQITKPSRVVGFPEAFTVAQRLEVIRSRPPSSSIGFRDRRRGDFRLMTVSDLLDESVGTAATLTEVLPPDTPVLIVTRSPEATLRAYLAAILANRPPAIFPNRLATEAPDRTRRRIAEAASALGVHGVLTEESRLKSIPQTGALATTILGSPPNASGSAVAELPTGSLDSICHFQFSSGSTRKPAAIAITNGNVLAHLGALSTRIGLASGDTVVSWLPLGHDMGLIGNVLLALVTGVDLRLMSPFEFLTKPIDWLKAVSEHQGAMTAAPAMAFDLATRRIDVADMTGIDLSTWKRAYCGAEPVHVPTIERFVEKFAPFGFNPKTLIPTYGLAEATLMATMPEPAATPRYIEMRTSSVRSGAMVDVVNEHTFGSAAIASPGNSLVACLGPPADNVDLFLQDEAGRRIANPHQIGEITVSGPGISPGTRRPEGGLDPFETPYRTGDLGFFHDGELVVIDRTKSVLIWNGQNYSASLSEHQLASATDVAANRLSVIEYQPKSGEKSIAVIVELGRGQDAAKVADVVLAAIPALDHPVHEVMVIPSGGIPRTTSGKPRREEIRTDLATGTMASLVRRYPSGTEPTERRAAVLNGTHHAAPTAGAAVDDRVDIDIDEEDARSAIYRVITETLRNRGRSVGKLHDSLSLRDDLGLDSLDLLDVCVGFEDAVGVVVQEEDLPGIETVGDLLVLRHNRVGVALGSLIDEIQRGVPQVWRQVSSQRGRTVVIDGHELVDLASVNYLGLDLDPEVMSSISPMVQEWGVHPSWTRAVASPAPYEQLESMLADLTGARDTLVFPSISLLHIGVLPLLAQHGTIVVEQTAHQSIQVAADTARSSGIEVRRFDFEDLSTLDAALRAARPGPRIVALDGVYSMSGDLPPLGDIADLAERYGAEVYVDDAHGIGVIGSDPTPENPYGTGGGGIIKHLGLDPDRFIYVSGLSKSFSSMAAFITLRNEPERRNLQRAGSIIFSGPIPVASLASAIKGLEINEQRGDQLRSRLLDVTKRLIRTVDAAGFERSSQTQFPIVNLVIGALSEVVDASKIMWEEGVLLTPSVFPAAPLNRGGLRMSLTASHSDEELVRADKALRRLASRTTTAANGSPRS